MERYVCFHPPARAVHQGGKDHVGLAKKRDGSRLGCSAHRVTQRKRGDTTTAEHLVRGFVDRVWKTDWPGSARPNVYYDPRALEQDGPGGVLHAKGVVTDEEVVFVTSANLTAFDHNIEEGPHVRDRALAASLSFHFRGLIDRGLLRPLPMMKSEGSPVSHELKIVGHQRADVDALERQDVGAVEGDDHPDPSWRGSPRTHRLAIW